MDKNKFIIQASMYSPTTSLAVVKEKYQELVREGIIKEVKTTKELKLKLSLPELFDQKIMKDNNFLLKLKSDYNMKSDLFMDQRNKFLAYRCEKGEGQKKHLWEKKSTFDVKLRFLNWISSNKQTSTIGQKKLTII